MSEEERLLLEQQVQEVQIELERRERRLAGIDHKIQSVQVGLSRQETGPLGRGLRVGLASSLMVREAWRRKQEAQLRELEAERVEAKRDLEKASERLQLLQDELQQSAPEDGL